MTSIVSRLVRPSGVEEIAARIAIAVALLLALMVHPAPAHETKIGTLVLDHPWVRETPPAAKVAGGFVTITNTGSEPDRLVGGTAAFAGRVEVHEMAMEGDVMKMRQLADGLEIPAGGSVVLKPGSFHVMFMDLAAPVKAGDALQGTLTFEKAGTVDVVWQAEAMGGQAGQAHGQDGH